MGWGGSTLTVRTVELSMQGDKAVANRSYGHSRLSARSTLEMADGRVRHAEVEVRRLNNRTHKLKTRTFKDTDQVRGFTALVARRIAQPYGMSAVGGPATPIPQGQPA